MNTSTDPIGASADAKAWKNGKNKNEQIIEGCKKLARGQKQGQCFTETEIAKACDVHPRAVVFIIRRALSKVGQALAQDERLLSEVFHDRPVREVADKIESLHGSIYRTGRKGGRNQKAKPMVEVLPKKKIKSLSDIAKQINSENSHKKWGAKPAAPVAPAQIAA